MEHTKTPWIPYMNFPTKQYEGCFLGSMGLFDSTPEKNTIATIDFHKSTEIAKANAEFIVRAINSHDFLLNAAKDAAQFIYQVNCDSNKSLKDKDGIYQSDAAEIVEILQDAIDKAEYGEED